MCLGFLRHIMMKNWIIIDVDLYRRNVVHSLATEVSRRKCGPRDSTWGGYKWTFWCIHPRHIGING